MKLLIYRGTSPSASALALRDSLREAGVDVVVNRRSSTRLRTRRKVINWGRRRSAGPFPMLNSPSAVANAADKLRALRLLSRSNVRVPRFYTHIDPRPSDTILVARTVLNGHSGRGIHIIRAGDSLVDAPLYTEYVPKSAEYRVHVFDGKVIFVQQKRKKNGVEQSNDEALIRSHANGWVFAENSVEWRSDEQKEETYSTAARAVESLGLDFGAVDVVISNRDHMPYVLEVNTAPALISTKLKQAYSDSIRRYFSDGISSNS